MPLWGTDATASGQANKPKWLSTSEDQIYNKMIHMPLTKVGQLIQKQVKMLMQNLKSYVLLVT